MQAVWESPVRLKKAKGSRKIGKRFGLLANVPITTSGQASLQKIRSCATLPLISSTRSSPSHLGRCYLMGLGHVRVALRKTQTYDQHPDWSSQVSRLCSHTTYPATQSKLVTAPSLKPPAQSELLALSQTAQCILSC
eukprot:6476372-Amphidinium_carterae.2